MKDWADSGDCLFLLELIEAVLDMTSKLYTHSRGAYDSEIPALRCLSTAVLGGRGSETKRILVVNEACE